MRTILSIIFLTSILNLAISQTSIKGVVTDNKGEKIAGANLYIKNTYEGATSGLEGEFAFNTALTGDQILVISFIGYETLEKVIQLDGGVVPLEIIMKPNSSELGGVTITAGFFEASDERKAVILRPLDIVTTAGGLADISAVMNTLPGTMVVGEEGKLFVRGGDSYETKTFIDGLLVQKPYGSTMPDVPSRGRFSPYLFSGTMFSTGGYSAEYGQALSSALILNTTGLPETTVAGISLTSIGPGVSYTKRWEKTSLSGSFDYHNLAPYFSLIPQNMEWDKPPRGYSGMVNFRQKAGNNGILKGMGTFTSSRSQMLYPDLANIGSDIKINLNDDNSYFNANYQNIIREKWITKAGISYMSDVEKKAFGEDKTDNTDNSLFSKYSTEYLFNQNVTIKGGVEWDHRNSSVEYFSTAYQGEYNGTFTENLFAGFLESEIRINGHLAARAGGRAEYSALLNRWNVAPRLSMAVKTGKESQISLAWGNFYQNPDDEYLHFTHHLDFEKAMHYIINYQITKNRRTLRVEAYWKKYDNLVKYIGHFNPDPSNYSNTGTGYARGIDVFWRDQKTFSNGDYWISYSYADSKREYKDYPEEAVPPFVSKHNLSFVFKYWVEKLSTQFGGTYSYASGRTYYNPNTPDFLSDKTQPYHDFSVNASFLTEIFKQFTIVHLSVSNVFGFNNVYGYHYQSVPSEDGTYNSFAIKPWTKRFIFLGIFISV